MRKQGLFFGFLILALASAAVFPAQSATTVTVKPSSMHGWYIAQEIQPTGVGSFVSGPPPVPLGSGSAQLAVDSTGRVILATTTFAGAPLSQITSLAYHAYRSTPDAANNLAINLQFDVNYDARGGGHANEGQLVYEPYLQPGWDGNINEDTWYPWAPLSGRWWATRSPGSDSCPKSNPCDWATVNALFPYAAIRASAGNLLFKAGGPWGGGFTGNVDAFTIGVGGVETTYDFEPETLCTADCYVDAASGNDSFGGDTPDSAKQTIQAGIAAVDPGGTVHVAAGVYPEQALVTKSLHLVGEDGSNQTYIQAPAGIQPASDPASTVVSISGVGVEAELTGFTIQGPGPSACGSLGYGVFVRDGAAADIHDNRLQDIRDEPFSGCQNGVAIQVGRAALDTTGTATITANLIVGYQKNGITVSHSGSSAVISGNTLTGTGPTATIAQNGIQVSGGATAQIVGNTVSDHAYTPGVTTATGILLYNADADASGNTLEENQTGLYHLEGSGTHDANLIEASAAGTGAPEFWGMVIDAPPPGLTPSPLEETVAPQRVSVEFARQLRNQAEVVQSVVITNNEFTGDGGSAGTGLAAYGGYGDLDISLTASNNVFSGWGTAIETGECAGEGCTSKTFTLLDFSQNSITGSSVAGFDSRAAPQAQAQASWWGSSSGPTHAGNPSGTGDRASDGVAYEPWLCDGTDTDPATGFQPDADLVCGGGAPDTEITAGPEPQPTDQNGAEIGFTGTDDFTPAGNLAFECALDPADPQDPAWEACTSPATFNGLADGSHTFLVRAIDPGGSADPSPASLTWEVDTQSPAVLELSSFPDPLAAGSAVPFSAVIDDTGLGDHAIVSAQYSTDGGDSWDTLGAADGTFDAVSEQVDGSLTAPAEGSLELCVRGNDIAGNTATPVCTALTVDPAPQVSADGPYSGTEGSPVDLSATADDGDGSDLIIAWSYAPGGNADAGATCAFGDPAALETTITCSDDGAYNLEVSVDDGTNPPVAAQAELTVANTAPQVEIASPADGAGFTTGQAVTVLATHTDPGGNDTHACQIDWGDASGQSPAQEDCNGEHTYTQSGEFTIQVTAVDDDSASGNAQVRITVAGLAEGPPIAEAGGPYNSKEGQAVQLLGGASDPDLDPLATEWSYVGKGWVHPGTTCTFGDKYALQTSFTCDDNGTFVLTLTVSDGNNPPVKSKTTVKIANQPPKVKITKPTQASLVLTTSPVDLLAVYQDPGSNDTNTCEIDWGDGEADMPQAGSGTCSGVHTFWQPGTFTITVTTRDDDGGKGSASVLVTVVEEVEGGKWIYLPVVLH